MDGRCVGVALNIGVDGKGLVKKTKKESKKERRKDRERIFPEEKECVDRINEGRKRSYDRYN